MPMRILLTADWHIKLGQKNVPKEWAISRYKSFFDRISELSDSHDLHIISGDIFDRLPNLEELEIYFEFVAGCKIPTIITTGNHEAESRKSSFLERLKKPTLYANSLVTISTEIESSAEHGFYDAEFYLVPYECIKKKETWDNLPRAPVFTHVRGAIEPHVKPEISLDWLDKFPVVFAGDLHSHQNTQRNIVYPGSPMTTSFHRNLTKNTNGFISIDTNDWSWTWKDFELPQLIRKTITDKSDMIKTDFHHTIYELEGTIDSVSGEIEDKELLDKKIVTRNSVSTLALNDKMTIAQELEQYLDWVLNIDNITPIMEAYYEHRNTENT